MTIKGKIAGALVVLLGLVLLGKLALEQRPLPKSTIIDQSKVQLLRPSYVNPIEPQTTADSHNSTLDRKQLQLSDEQIITSVKKLRNDIEVKINDLIRDRYIITDDHKYCAFLVNSMSTEEKAGYVSRVETLYEQASTEKKGYLREMEKHVIDPLLEEFSKPLCVEVSVDGDGFASWSTFNTDELGDVKTNDFGMVLKPNDVVGKASLYSAYFESRFGQAIPDKIRKTMEDAKTQSQVE